MAIQPLRILIIEDEPAHAAAIGRSLDVRVGAELRVMTSLQEFRDEAVAWNPDIALMDLNLPGGQVLEVLGDPTDARTFPVIVMTSQGSGQAAVEALKSGAWDYLTKSQETFRDLPHTLERVLREWTLRIEGKRMHRELKASEAQYRSLAESSTDFIMRFDRTCRHTYLNTAALEMLELKASDILGKTHLECGFPEELCHFWEARIEQVFQTAQPSQTEFEFQSPHGRVTHDWRLIPEFDTKGTVHAVLGVSRDITQRKQAEEALRQSQESFASLFEHALLGMYRTSAEGRILMANEALRTMLGFASFEALAQCKFEDNPTYDAARFRGALLEKSRVAGMESLWTRPDGTTVVLRENARSVHDASGNLIYFEGIVEDITERRQAADALRRSEEKYRLAMEATSEGLWDRNTQTGEVYYSPGYFTMLGYQAEDFPPWHDTWLELLHPEDRENAIRVNQDCIEGRWEFIEQEFRLKASNGEWRNILSRGKCLLRDEQGRALRLMGTHVDITERKRVEAALRASEERFTRIFQMSPDAIDLTRMNDGVSLDLNSSYTKLFGYTAEEFIGHSTLPGDLGLWINKEDRDRHVASLQEQGEALGFEAPLRRKDGSTFIAQISSSALEIDGEPCNVTITRDITERKLAEEELQASRQQLKDIIDFLPDATLAIDQERRIIIWNKAIEKMTGIPAAEMLGKGNYAYTIPFYGEARTQLMDLVFEHNEETQARYSNITREGDTLVAEVFCNALYDHKGAWTVVKASPLHDQSGNVIGAIESIRDITERKLAEEALRESDGRFQGLLQSVDFIAVQGYAPNGTTQYWNHASEQLYGYSAEEALGQSLLDLIIPPEMREEVAQSMQQMRETGQTIPSSELSLMRKDGSRIAVISSHAIVHVPGRAPELFCMDIDLTDRKRAEEQQRQLQAQLQQAQKMESLGNLAGGIAHDMNNVLGAILGFASANIEAHPVDSRTYHAFDVISQAAVRGGKMVKSLLNFARQSPAEERELDMNEVLREQVSLLERTTLSKIRLELDLGSGLRPIRGDASALTHAFMNLCVNAVDAMPESGTLTLRTRNVDSEWIEALVEDTGTGMPKEVLEKALDPFFTTKEIGKGTGLGLSMVYSTVKAHHGQIEILSEPGLGTRVRMRFPTCEVTVPTPAAGAESSSAASPGALQVLVVDDDELIQSTMQAILEVLGHTVTAVFSGEEALAKLKAGLPADVVILDMNMPGLGGTGTLPRLRVLRPSVPVLLATGRADQAAQHLTEAYPFVTLLSKPFSLEELQACLAPFAQRPSPEPGQ